MARKARVEYVGAVYHVLDRGDRREAIFQDDGDRRRFLETLGEACGRTGWRVHAYVLMSNHYHLMIETPQANLVAGDALVPDAVDDPVQPASPAERAPFCLSFPKRRANFGNESEIWVAVARAVWEQTTVDTTWLAEHLHLRSAANASQQIRRHRQQPPELSKDLQRWMIQSRNVA
jgi:hypothetical protein